MQRTGGDEEEPCFRIFGVGYASGTKFGVGEMESGVDRERNEMERGSLAER